MIGWVNTFAICNTRNWVSKRSYYIYVKQACEPMWTRMLNINILFRRNRPAAKTAYQYRWQVDIHIFLTRWMLHVSHHWESLVRLLSDLKFFPCAQSIICNKNATFVGPGLSEACLLPGLQHFYNTTVIWKNVNTHTRRRTHLSRGTHFCKYLTNGCYFFMCIFSYFVICKQSTNYIYKPNMHN